MCDSNLEIVKAFLEAYPVDAESHVQPFSEVEATIRRNAFNERWLSLRGTWHCGFHKTTFIAAKGGCPACEDNWEPIEAEGA